ncbi:MAG: ribosomal protein S18-alanine N-acetyltransferase [Anaerovoracaceae bacterium]
MGEITVRQAEKGDVAALADLDRRCFSAPWSEESFRKEIEENNIAFYIVAELAGKIVGYAGLWWIANEGHITNVAVDSQYRGKGLGTVILETLIGFTSEEGIEEFTLEVRPSNEPALALYEKFDFCVEGRRPKYYEDNGEDALILWRRKV